MEVATVASPSAIIWTGDPLMLLGDDVVDVKRRSGEIGKVAIFAPRLGPLADKFA